MYIQSPEEEKKRTNSKLMAQLVGLAEYLRLFVDQVRCFEDDNETHSEKLDSQKLEKLVCQLQVMCQVAQESWNTLRDLDYTAFKKSKIKSRCIWRNWEQNVLLVPLQGNCTISKPWSYISIMLFFLTHLGTSKFHDTSTVSDEILTQDYRCSMVREQVNLGNLHCISSVMSFLAVQSRDLN